MVRRENSDEPAHSATKRVVYLVLAISVLPFAASLLGVSLEFPSPEALRGETSGGNPDPSAAALEQARGPIVHSILEWTAVCIAALTVLLAFTHYAVKRDAATPIIGMAFFCVGCMDAFHTLAANRLITTVADPADLLPATWALGRSFNALILTAGVGLLLLLRDERRKTSLGLVLATCVVFGGVSYFVVHIYATASRLPRTVYPDWIVTRPWDLLPLVLFAFVASGLCLRFHRREPSVFSFALLVSVIPQVAAQLHMTLGSAVLFDAHFNMAHFLKAVAYSVPLCGLMVDYIHTYRGQERTVEKLEDTREDLDRRSGELELANLRLNLQAKDMIQSRRAADAANEAKSEFLANMSHEIRTPMTIILGLAEELEHTDPDSAELKSRLATIHDNGKYLLEILNDILDLSKIEAGKFRVERVPSPPSTLVADIAKLMNPKISAKGLRFEVKSFGLVPEMILVDPTRLRQILINLLGNAFKFTDRGFVRLEYRLVTPGADGGEGLEEPALRFDVIDSGIGMTREQLQVVFEPFTQGRVSGSGTGLGLTICKRLVGMLGGDLDVSSEPGHGTKFRVRIPTGPLDKIEMCHDPEFAATPNSEGSSRGNDESLCCRILLVEDNREILKFVSRLLTMAGADVHGVESGEDAVDVVSAGGNGQGSFDVVLMDMQLPGMDGYAATRVLRNQGYRGAILAMTASAMTSDRERFLGVGCNDVVAKPIDRAKLFAAIRNHISAPEPAPGQVPDAS